MQRRLEALQRSPNANERLLGTVATVITKARQDEQNRLCDMCHLPKRECELLSKPDEGGDGHIFAPMPIEQQLALQETQAAVDDGLNGHFSGHKPGCTLNPKVCQITSGGI